MNIKYFIIFIIFALIISCSTTYHSNWNWNWEYLNYNDSTRVIKKLDYIFMITPWSGSNPEYKGNFTNGQLLLGFGISEKEEYCYNKLNIRSRIFFLDSTLIDTTLSWKEMDFIKGKDQWGNDNQNVSYKNFYITVPDTS